MGYVADQPLKYRRRLRGKRTPFGDKLRSLTGPVFSTKTGTGCPRMRNTKYIQSYHLRGRRFLDDQKVPHHLIQAQLEGRCQLKVSAKWGLFTLLYFDLDTHTHGSPEDVRLLAQVICEHFPAMPGFVFNERGGSGWLVVNTSGVSPAEYNQLVRRLEVYFRSVSEAMGLNVQYVEVKGRVYEHTFHDGKMTAVKAGDLLKCPPAEAYLDQPPVEAERFAGSEFDSWGPVNSSGITAEVDQPSVAHVYGVRNGSFHSQLVTADIQARLPNLEGFIRTQFADRPQKVERWAISDRAFAELLLVLVLLKPNGDGSNPCLRHRNLIEELHRQGVVEFGFNHRRYKAVRDYLSSKLAIHWVDETYRPGSGGREGQAMKWGLDPVLIRQVEEVIGLREWPEKEQDSTLVDTIQVYTGQHRVPRLKLTLVDLPDGHEEAIAAMFRCKEQFQLAA